MKSIERAIEYLEEVAKSIKESHTIPYSHNDWNNDDDAYEEYCDYLSLIEELKSIKLENKESFSDLIKLIFDKETEKTPYELISWLNNLRTKNNKSELTNFILSAKGEYNGHSTLTISEITSSNLMILLEDLKSNHDINCELKLSLVDHHKEAEINIVDYWKPTEHHLDHTDKLLVVFERVIFD